MYYTFFNKKTGTGSQKVKIKKKLQLPQYVLYLFFFTETDSFISSVLIFPWCLLTLLTTGEQKTFLSGRQEQINTLHVTSIEFIFSARKLLLAAFPHSSRSEVLQTPSSSFWFRLPTELMHCQSSSMFISGFGSVLRATSLSPELQKWNTPCIRSAFLIKWL